MDLYKIVKGNSFNLFINPGEESTDPATRRSSREDEITLLITPVLFVVFDEWSARIGRRVSAAAPARQAIEADGALR